MAKTKAKAKAKAKKVVKKAAKTAKKAVKKASKKVAKKAKAVKKKAAPKAKAAKKVVKKAAKKAAKKVVKKAAKKVTKKVVKKAAPKKAVKVVKKAVKKVVKKVAPKKTGTFENIKDAVSGFVKNAVETIVEKVTPSHANDSSSEETTSENNTSSNHSNDNEDSSEGSDKSEEEERFKPHSSYLMEGDAAPYFEGVDQFGNTVKSTDFLGKTLILYFYPKDFTEGCTAESCNLRDEYRYLTDNHYAVVGVSADDVDSHKRFANEYNLPFKLIADTDLSLIKAYDVWGQKQVEGKIYDGIVRTTFVIDAEGNIKNIIRKVDNANAAKQILSL